MITLRRLISGTALLLVFCMTAGIFLETFLPSGKKPTDWLKNIREDQFSEGNFNQTAGLRDAAKVSAVSFAGIQTLATAQGVNKTITAAVKPESALNKEVDWELSWADEGIAENISDYLTISPESDGALTATVNCKKSFRGKEAVATVTTRDGGFTASCYISYAGEPSFLTVNGGAAGECYLGRNTSFSVELTNVFGDVGEEFYDELIIDGITFGGTCTTATKWVTVSGRNAGTVSYTDVRTNVPLSDLKYEESSALADMFDVSVSGKTLTVSAPSLSGVYSNYTEGSGTQDIYYDYYYGDWNGYADITVKYGKFGFSSTFRAKFILGVEGVSVTPSVQF